MVDKTKGPLVIALLVAEDYKVEVRLIDGFPNHVRLHCGEKVVTLPKGSFRQIANALETGVPLLHVGDATVVVS